jgi:hypothetical protein
MNKEDNNNIYLVFSLCALRSEKEIDIVALYMLTDEYGLASLQLIKSICIATGLAGEDAKGMPYLTPVGRKFLEDAIRKVKEGEFSSIYPESDLSKLL